MTRQIIRLTFVVILSAVFTACEKTPDEAVQGTEPSAFTTATAIELPGCGNLYQVSDKLYRGEQPLFVHCQHGADRTGMMVAAYRIIVEGWDVDKAIDEMRNGPFGFHEIWTGLPKFIEELDVERLRQNFGPTQ